MSYKNTIFIIFLPIFADFLVCHENLILERNLYTWNRKFTEFRKEMTPADPERSKRPTNQPTDRPPTTIPYISSSQKVENDGG